MNKYLKFTLVLFSIYLATTAVFFLGYFCVWFIELREPELNPLLWSGLGRFSLTVIVIIEFTTLWVNTFTKQKVYDRGE